MKGLTAGIHTSDRNGAALSGIPSQRYSETPPVRNVLRNAIQLPLSIRYAGPAHPRYRVPVVQGLGNGERVVLPADVWITGNNYNKTAVYRPPTAVANPSWRIDNLTDGDIKRVDRLQALKKQQPPKRKFGFYR